MHLVVIAWIYVALLMAVAEATSPVGTVVGAMLTFLLYGVAPVSLLVYLMSTPARKRAIRAREAAEANERQTAGSGEPDARGEAPADPVAAVREEP